MKKQIRELAIQVGAGTPQSLYGRTDYIVMTEFELQRFAELIVRECIDKIETYRIPVGNSAAGEMACEWTYDALKKIRDDIREHFGVEE
jgi:hypothetical protein